jgi:hypothetical protein
MISKINKSLLVGSSTVLSLALLMSHNASAQSVDLSNPQSIENYTDLNAPQNINNDSMGQVTNVNQLRDVAPTDWAYEALRSLVDRYGCIAGYPN